MEQQVKLRINENNESLQLSICIATFNRAKFIGETLDSILAQMEPGVELLVVDGASPDSTSEVMAQYVSSHPEIRYYREQENSGVDRDYDKAVGYAKGEYCWLMTDDDLLCHGAIRKVLSAIESKVDLVVINAQVRNADMSEILLDRRLNITSDLEYGNQDREEFFVETANYLGFIGGVVIRRNFWLSRDRKNYYGTLFIHVGVIFQHPPIGMAKVIAEPLIEIRNGNAMWTPRGFEIWTFKWPALIWSFSDFADDAKQAVCHKEPWRRTKSLFFHRAMGAYSLVEFHKYLSGCAKGGTRVMAFLTAACPGALANFIVVLYYVLIKRKERLTLYDVQRSRYATATSRLLIQVMKIKSK